MLDLTGVLDLTGAEDPQGMLLWPAGSARQVAAAEELAADLLGDDEQRWAHTQAVAARAQQAAPVLSADRVPVLLAAAWLHDVGYARELRDTGFHPLDGARYLSELGFPALVAGLVAHHSAARYVAQASGLQEQMRRYQEQEQITGPLADALTWADQTTRPTGQSVDVQARLAEKLLRHGLDSPNARAHPQRGPAIEQAVADTTDRLLLRHAGRRLVNR